MKELLIFLSIVALMTCQNLPATKVFDRPQNTIGPIQ
jgi:hypothetical protein